MTLVVSKDESEMTSFEGGRVWGTHLDKTETPVKCHTYFCQFYTIFYETSISLSSLTEYGTVPLVSGES